MEIMQCFFNLLLFEDLIPKHDYIHDINHPQLEDLGLFPLSAKKPCDKD